MEPFFWGFLSCAIITSTACLLRICVSTDNIRGDLDALNLKVDDSTARIEKILKQIHGN